MIDKLAAIFNDRTPGPYQWMVPEGALVFINAADTLAALRAALAALSGKD